MLKIESAQNATFKKLANLTSAKGLKKENLLLLSGAKLIDEYIALPHIKRPLKIIYEIVTPRMSVLTEVLGTRAPPVIQLSAELFAQLDALGTRHNILVLEQPPMPILEAKDFARYTPRGLEVVIPVGDPGNLGALIRSCEAFGVPRVILTREAAHPFLPRAIKASAGSVLRVPLSQGPELSAFPENCIALDKDGTPVQDFKWPARGLLVVGEEGPGLGGHGPRFRQRIGIPTERVESLNVSVAAGIALAYRAQRSAKRRRASALVRMQSAQAAEEHADHDAGTEGD